MPNSRCYNSILGLAAMLAILVVVLSNDVQSDSQENAIVPYPTQDYLSWSTSNEIPWTIDFEDGYNDKSSLKSGPIECVGSSRLMMNIPGPATIRFKWKIDAPSGIGQLFFKVDGNKTFECLSRDWTEFSYPLSPGVSHDLEWCYRKIKSYPLWSGTGWIDNINAIQTGQYSNTKYITRLSDQVPQINESQKNEVSNNACNMSDYSLGIINQNTNKVYSEANQIINITVMIENTESMHKDIACTPSEDIIIKLLSPTNHETLSNNNLLKFKYIPNSSKIIKNCSLIIDGEKKDHSEDIKNNEINEFIPEMIFEKTKLYEWNMRCCNCNRECNSSEYMYFRVSDKNKTTYVNRSAPDSSRFIFENFRDAIDRTEEGGLVVIDPGNYEEQLNIDKPLSIIGKNFPSLNRKIIINSNKISISGLNVTDSESGICMKNHNYINISNSYINVNGNRCIGVCAENCHNCSFYNNTLNINTNNYMSDRYIGMYLKNCGDCTISTNKISGYNTIGVFITNSGIDTTKKNEYILEDNEFNQLLYNIRIKEAIADYTMIATKNNRYSGFEITNGTLQIDETNRCGLD
jgi:parallel beta-helix repeat protein